MNPIEIANVEKFVDQLLEKFSIDHFRIEVYDYHMNCSWHEVLSFRLKCSSLPSMFEYLFICGLALNIAGESFVTTCIMDNVACGQCTL